MTGNRDRAFEHLGNARRLVEPLPPSPARARVASMASRFLMLASEDQEAIRQGEEALAMAGQFGLDEIRAATLNNVGTARAALGEEEGLDQVAEAIEVARAANSPFEVCRAIGNLAAQCWARGRVGEATELWRESAKEAGQYGQQRFARWDEGVLVGAEYGRGLWDEALVRADAFLAEVEAGSPHYLAAQCYTTRAGIRLARGEIEGRIEEADRALALAERAKDPQILYGTLADAAHVLHDAGETERAVALAWEYLDALEAGQRIGFSVSAAHVASWTLAAAGRGDQIAAALEQLQIFPWARAGAAFGRGDPVTAADICAAIGAVTQEAYARLAAARLLVEQGKRAEADEQLHRALAFYRSVGATLYVRQGESLLAASA
jgi:hypothetical protein